MRAAWERVDPAGVVGALLQRHDDVDTAHSHVVLQLSRIHLRLFEIREIALFFP